MAKLTELLIGRYPELSGFLGDKKKTQHFLDSHTQEIINRLSEDEIVEFSGEVYNETAQQYNEDSHTQDVPKELPVFLKNFSPSDLILDLGCGHGRDSKYILEKGMQVVPYDFSSKLIRITLGKTRSRVPAFVVGDFTNPGRDKLFFGTELNSSNFDLTFEKGKPQEIFDGIWACTSLLIHTPVERINSAVNYWGKTLKKDGLFAVSYFNPNRVGFSEGYGLRASSTGEIKIFASPNYEQVRNAFNKAGMSLEEKNTSDYVDKLKEIDQKSFFINEVYRKN